MITKETCVKIWNCHNEIEKAKKLLKDIADQNSTLDENVAPTLYNAFGEKRALQLGVPSGDSSHSLYNVNRELGVKIIEQHIVDMEKRLTELLPIAAQELNENI